MRSEGLVAAALAVLPLSGAAAAAPPLELGHAPTPAELKAWDIDVRGDDGAGLPPGHGSVAQGATLFASKCASCHGSKGQGGTGPALAGGIGSLATGNPVKTVGSYWPWAPTLYDYIHRAMPFDAPQSLSADQTYAATAYVLRLNGLVPADAVMDARSLPKVVMPNRHGFTGDLRPMSERVGNERLFRNDRARSQPPPAGAAMPASAFPRRVVELCRDNCGDRRCRPPRSATKRSKDVGSLGHPVSGAKPRR